MVGTYPDAPGQRMAYDRDGTSLVRVLYSASSVSTFSGIDTMNAEAGNGVTLASGTNPPELGTIGAGLIFPELRDVVGVYHGIYLAWNNGTPTYNGMYWSPDTTNGIDGTWTLVSAPTRRSETDKVSMRNDIEAHSLTGVKGLMFRATIGSAGGRVFRARVHVYGSPSAGAAPNRLRFWDPTLDQAVTPAFFDWGDVNRSTTLTKTFRIKNPSSTLTANSVTLAVEALSDTSPTNTSAHEFSTDNITFASSINIGNLAPGALSSVLYVRRTTPASGVLGLWWCRLVASAASFT